MASRATLDTQLWWRIVLRRGGAMLASACAALFVGCPPHEQPIILTGSGIQSLLAACNRVCGPRDDDGDGDAGAGQTCFGSCGIAGHLPPEWSQPTQARLFLLTPSDGQIRSASKCMTLPQCKQSSRSTCLSDALNQQLDGAIANGLGFDGLKDPFDVELFMAIYQQQDFTPQDTNANEPGCRRIDLVACAGLAPPLGGGAYDMSCASCQAGPQNPQSRDNGPCPLEGNGCFLDKCDGWLRDNGYE